MANDSWDWPAAFERAGKDENFRLTETLKPEDFARALRSMWVEHGMLERSDPRVQEFSRSGRLEWWDGRGRCVVLVREGADQRQWTGPSLGGLIPKGFAPPLGQPFTHPLPEPDSPRGTQTLVLGGPITDEAAFRAQAGPGAVPTYPEPYPAPGATFRHPPGPKGTPEARALEEAEQAKIDAKPKGKKK